MHVSGALLQRIEIGERRPARDLAVRCDEAFRTGGELVQAWEQFSESEAQERLREFDTDISPADAGESPDEVSTTERRDFLLLSGSIAAGSLPAILEHELNQIHMALSRTDERVDYLERRADDLGMQVAKAPTRATLESALAVLSSTRDLLERRQPMRVHSRLVAVSAKLSLVVGVGAFDAGHARLALEWHKAAQYAASDSGARFLMDIALAQQAFTPLYSGSSADALRMVAARLDNEPSPSPAVAQLWGISARAQAAMGERRGFRRSIERGWECIGNSDPASITPGILSFHPANLAFYETTGASALGDLGGSLDAADRALELFSGTESVDRVLVGLERATALAKSGEVSDACHAAKAVMLDPKTFRCAPVLSYARNFTETLRDVRSAEVREWREMIADLKPTAFGPQPGKDQYAQSTY